MATLRQLTGITQPEMALFTSSQDGHGGQTAVSKAENGDQPAIPTLAVYILLALATPEQRDVAAAILRRMR